MKYYLAYGSNLSMAQMAQRCPSAVPVGVAILNGYELVFRGSGSGAYLTIIPTQGGSVPCAVWLISDDDESALDAYEGYPSFYGKFTTSVEVTPFFGSKFDVKAMVYALPANSNGGCPTDSYVLTCLEGYFRFGFDPVYLKEALFRTDGESFGEVHWRSIMQKRARLRRARWSGPQPKHRDI